MSTEFPAAPKPEEIRAARERAGLKQREAAAVIYKSLNTWQQYEAPEGTKSHRAMDPALFELFEIKTTKKKR